MKTKNILITGRPRVGKTTLIKYCAKILGNRAGGFYTEEIKGEGVRGRRGFLIKTLGGEEVILAEVDYPSTYCVGRYGVHLENIDNVGVPALLAGIQDKEWVIIDEIGKMEEGSPAFKTTIIKALSSNKKVLASIRWNDDEFTSAIKSRKDVELIKLTVPNREEIYSRIENLLRTSQ